jgi:hypothetical protein
VRRKYIADAKKGNHEAGRAIVQMATASLFVLLRREDVEEPDRVVLKFLHDGLRAFLDGMPVDRALGVEREKNSGAPRKSHHVDFSRYMAVVRALDGQSKKGGEQNLPAAFKEAAMSCKVKAPSIKNAWLKFGGMKAYRRLRKPEG